MLRPATPLTIMLFAAFVLLLISVISTPVVKGIPLASFSGVNFGVFGYCQPSGCSKIEIGYNTASLFTNSETDTFDLPVSTRTTLSAILVIHPIAALFTLIMLILAAAAHFHSPSHSPRYLLGVFILSILTLLLSLLAFLIDVLLFVPHMAWGSYIVLAATIIIAASGIVSCAMRRTLVSRKARKRRIAENAEMNGENFYNRQAEEERAAAVAAPTVPPIVNGGPNADKLPSFATFEMSQKKEGSERTSDERIPLTARTPSERSPEGAPTTSSAGQGMEDRYGGPPQMGMNGRSPPRDQYGNPLPPGQYGQGGMRGGPPGYRGRGGGPPGGYRGRGGPGYYPGGRGGYGTPPRGGYGPGPNRGDNGMMGPMAAGAVGGMAAGAMMRGGRGPPPGYSNGGYGGPPSGRGYSRDPSPAGSYGPQYGRRGPSPVPSGNGSYGPGPMGAMQPAVRGYSPAPYPNNVQEMDDLPRAESPPPMPGVDTEPTVGQAVEMDATTGSPSHTPQGFKNQFGPLRDSDADVAGMVGLQQQRGQGQLGRQDTTLSATSRYSGDEPYVPPRAGWDQPAPRSPLSQTHPAELPNDPASGPHPSHRRQTSGDNYFEDMDPRFAEPPPPELQSHPEALRPGFGADPDAMPPHLNTNLHPSNSNPNFAHGLDGNDSYEDIQAGSRSPAESERSNFTSVSQRGVNPRWNPQMGGPGYGPPPMNRRPMPPNAAAQRNEILLNSNPDFELPGSRSGSRTGSYGTRGGRFGGPPPGGPGPMHPPSNMGGGGMIPRSAYEGGGPM